MCHGDTCTKVCTNSRLFTETSAVPSWGWINAMDGGQQSVFSADFFSIHYGFFSQVKFDTHFPISVSPRTGWKGFTVGFTRLLALYVPMASHRCADGALRVFVHIAG